MSASDKKELVIKDACILFDLLDLELLPHFYQLDLTVLTRPEVLDEITDETQFQKIQPYITRGELQIDVAEELDAHMDIVEANPGLSLTDAAVLETASRRGATILSSDGSLRKESGKRGIGVRGLLWILEGMYAQQLISKTVLIQKLQAYTAINQRAPKDEVEKLIKKYGG